MAPVAQIATPAWRLSAGSRPSPGFTFVSGTVTTPSDHRSWLDRRHEDRGFVAVDVS
jgi:hypothetical protein